MVIINLNVHGQKDMLKTGMFFKLGINMPNKNFADYFAPTSRIGQQRFSYTDHKIGYGFEFGTLFFLNGINLSEKAKLGIGVSWMEINYFQIRYRDSKEIELIADNPFEGYQLSAGVKVGPTYSVSPWENIAFDFSIKISPIYTFSKAEQSFEWIDYGSPWEFSSPNKVPTTRDLVGKGFGYLYCPSITIRSYILSFSLEYQFGNSYQNVVYDNGISFHNSESNSNLSQNNLNISVGVQF
jgi:hypothetical protein